MTFNCSQINITIILVIFFEYTLCFYVTHRYIYIYIYFNYYLYSQIQNVIFTESHRRIPRVIATKRLKLTTIKYG